MNLEQLADRVEQFTEIGSKDSRTALALTIKRALDLDTEEMALELLRSVDRVLAMMRQRVPGASISLDRDDGDWTALVVSTYAGDGDADAPAPALLAAMLRCLHENQKDER